MKLVYLLLILVAFQAVTSRRIRRHHARHHHRAPADNIVYQFILGFITALGGQEKLITECSAQFPGWESASTAQTDTTQTEMAGTPTTFQTVLKYLGMAIDAICNFKDNIIEFLTKKFRRYVRLFLQGKVRGRFGRGFFSGIWNGIKKGAAAVGNAVVSGAKAVGNTIIKGAEWVGKKAEELFAWCEKKFQELLEPVYELFESIKAKVVAWLEKNPTIKKLLEFGVCFLNNNGVKAIKTMFNAIKSIVELVPLLATPAGWIKLVINLVCGWKSLKEGIEAFIEGWNNTSAPHKFNRYGYAVGKFAEAIAG